MPTRHVRLVPITELQTDDQLFIRDIRNEPDVRKAMYKDHVISVNEHLQWISRLKTDPRQLVFGILADGPIGAVSLLQIDETNKRSDWGFYLSPKEHGRGTGPAIERRFLEFAFETAGLEKLSCAVLENNHSVVRLHKRFGFEEEGFRKSEIVRDGKRVGIHLLGLQKESWAHNEATLSGSYGKTFERFEIELHWTPERKSLTSIDQIEAARARNNVNWMNILRIAVEKSPANAKQIIAEIKEIDQQISALTSQIQLEP